MKRSLVLLADPTPARRRVVADGFETLGCVVREASHVGELVPAARAMKPSLVLAAFSAGDEAGALAAISELHTVDRRLPIVVIVDGGSESLATAMLRAGVKDYFSEPFDWTAIAARARAHLAEAGNRGVAQKPVPALTSLVAISVGMRELSAFVTRVAQQDSTVLITGETGTGKELVASLIHENSRRRHARFVSVNSAAIPEGLLESELFGHESGAFTGAAGRREGLFQAADGGTIFLDEIGDMAPQAQAKILRAIETKEVYSVGGKRPVKFDVRVVAATNQDLEIAVEEGRFRKDLYFRLNVARVHLPPLRERRSDIGVLLDYYLKHLNEQAGGHVQGFTETAKRALEAYDWPGNVRELRNLVEAVLIAPSTTRVTVEDFPEPVRSRVQAAIRGHGGERRRLIEALLAANWNKSQAAATLRWSRMTVYRKMAKYSVVRSNDPLRRRS